MFISGADPVGLVSVNFEINVVGGWARIGRQMCSIATFIYSPLYTDDACYLTTTREMLMSQVCCLFGLIGGGGGGGNGVAVADFSRTVLISSHWVAIINITIT